jgi:hypothetical protein
MREREEHDSAFRLRCAFERQQILRRVFGLGILWRRMRLHSPDLRLPLVFSQELQAI